jgi:GT2 family glycosyltransferase
MEVVKLEQCCICVLAFNRSDQLKITLMHLREEFKHSGVEVIVLNNGSTDDTRETLNGIKQQWPELKIVNSEVNLGCSKGREVLWRESDADYVLSIDEDILISRLDLEVLLQRVTSCSRGGLVSPLIEDSVSHKVLNPIKENPDNAKFFYEGCFLLSAKLIGDVGYFDAELLYAGEGLDYSIRLQKAGYRIMRESSVCVTHVDRVRGDLDWSGRRVEWAYSFAYLYWKNHTPIIACWLSVRNLLAHYRNSVFQNGLGYSLTLTQSWLQGIRKGVNRRQEIHLNTSDSVNESDEL